MDINNIDFSKLDPEEKEELLTLLEMREDYDRYNKIESFGPYEFQKKFYAASKTHKRRFLCAANRIGKSFSEAAEFAWHLTGVYPYDYEGHEFKKPILAWAVGITGESTQKVLQKELFGTSDARDAASIGTGAIPKRYIVPDSIARDGQRILSAKIKHFNKRGEWDGDSIIEFRSTQQGEHVLMGATVDYIWLDKLKEVSKIFFVLHTIG